MAQEPACELQAQQLAKKLDLPLVSSALSCDLLLNAGEHGISLSSTANNQPDITVQIDFSRGKTVYRRKQQRQELLVRAVGYKKDQKLTVIDGTGGFGRDSFLLATAGCTVHVFEKNRIIATLLDDGFSRAARQADTAAILRRITLSKCNVIPYLHKLTQTGKHIDVIYLDPMFPKRRKSALVKKDLQLLQTLATEPDKPDELLEAALDAASQRVVVKRPVKAPPLTSRTPSHNIAGKTIRFDVYMACML
jgi:16S rRNA (guanine1516-N2)-methyltransferase